MTEPVAPAIADLLADQRERWARGDRRAVEVYTRQHPMLRSNPEGLLDLIYQEVYLRERAGETPQREEYLRRFPRLAAAIGEQFDVHQAIQAGPRSDSAESLPILAGFDVLKEIGHGGMGRVYQARQQDSSALVAVKLLRSEHLANRTVRKRFLAEARAAASLDHPHIVKVLNVNECPSGPYFVMELVEGTNLEAQVQGGPVRPEQALQWLIPMAEAIHYAHGRGVIHRDLKPANIMLDIAGRPRVTDFGMAKVLRRAATAEPSSTEEGTILGTPAYMPPEQAGDSAVPPGPYNDVYSLGAILYALLTGQPPFDEGDFVSTVLKVRSADPAPAVRSLRPEVPEWLEEICHRCLNKRPADRYGTALELAEALRRCIAPATPSDAKARGPVSLTALKTGEVFPLRDGITFIGRAPDCELVLQAQAVSRRHCKLIRWGTQLLVEDLGSLHGTLVNGAKVTRKELNHGDRLEIARQAFEVVLGPG